MPSKFFSYLCPALSSLYASQLRSPASWGDKSDHAYLTTHLIERSIAGLAPRLKGELIDVGCGLQPYKNYYAHATRVVACDFDAKRGQVDFACPAHAVSAPRNFFLRFAVGEIRAENQLQWNARRVGVQAAFQSGRLHRVPRGGLGVEHMDVRAAREQRFGAGDARRAGTDDAVHISEFQSSE